MIELPSTIKHPNTFKNSPAAGFDGVFDWEWTRGCLGAGRITPMDFDGVVERKGNFIVFETKDAGVPIPKGQEITLKRVHELGVFTVMFIHGKSKPESVKAWCAPDFKGGRVMDQFAPIDLERARQFVSDWYQYADSNPKQKVDVSMLNRRVSALSIEMDLLAEKITVASTFINKALEILKG